MSSQAAILAILLACAVLGAANAAARDGRFVFPGDEVPSGTIRVTALGTGTPDVRREQVS